MAVSPDLSKDQVDGQDSSVPEEQRQTAQEPPDIRAVMAAIRDRVRADAERFRDDEITYQPSTAELNRAGNRKAGELLYSEELRYLNMNYGFSQLDPNAITTHRKGVLGSLVLKLKRRILTALRDSMLKSYLEREQEFQANVVRFLNDVAKYVDARDASNFWELIRKIDVDVSRAIEQIERIRDEQSASLRSAERRIADDLDERIGALQQSLQALHTAVASEQHRLTTVESVAAGLESLVARLGKSESAGAPAAPPDGTAIPDQSYLLLENRFRGSEDEISRRLAIYPPLFRGAAAPVLEIGSGRGELLALFAEAGISARGVDLDPAMVDASRAKGLDVALADGIEYLAGLPDDSLGGVIAVQVVEHLTKSQLERLCSLCARKVVNGGTVIFETINPRSLTALSSNYFRDPTHVFPQHPDTLSYTMALAGLRVREVRELSPVPDEAKLQLVEREAFMTPQWAFTVDRLNQNIRQLNGLLYGNQDYCVIAEAAAGIE